jgi:aminomethyltransferase
MKDGKDIGVVTSGSFSPSLSVGIGMGYVTSACPVGAAIVLKENDVEIQAIVTEKPFYKNGTAKTLEDVHANA